LLDDRIEAKREREAAMDDRWSGSRSNAGNEIIDHIHDRFP